MQRVERDLPSLTAKVPGGPRFSAAGATGHEFGGEGEIRTHGSCEGTPVFKTGAFNRSATSPLWVHRRNSGYFALVFSVPQRAQQRFGQA